MFKKDDEKSVDSQKSIKSFFSKGFHILVAAGWGFSRDECALKASALTYYSLLSVAPLLAVLFGIAKGFGFEKHLEAQILEQVQQQQVAETVISIAYSLLEQSEGGLIAGMGVIALLWSCIGLFGNIESSLNAIWKVKKQRSFSRKFSDYLAIVIFCPIFFVASSSVSIFVMTKIISASQASGVYETVSPLIYLAFHFFPLVLNWVLFSFLYVYMPNTHVNLKYAIAAGVIAGTAYQIVQWIYIHFQIGVSSYGAIYGSFAAIPLFLGWLQVSWLIVLAGAEIAYHAEIAPASLEIPTEKQLMVSKRELAILFTQHFINAFSKDIPPLSLEQLSQQWALTLRLTREIIGELVDRDILVEVKKNDGTLSYHPARDAGFYTFRSVCSALDISSHPNIPINFSKELQTISNELKRLDDVIEHSPENIHLKDLPF